MGAKQGTADIDKWNRARPTLFGIDHRSAATGVETTISAIPKQPFSSAIAGAGTAGGTASAPSTLRSAAHACAPPNVTIAHTETPLNKRHLFMRMLPADRTANTSAKLQGRNPRGLGVTVGSMGI